MRLGNRRVLFAGAGVDAGEPGVDRAHGLGGIAGMGRVAPDHRTGVDPDGRAEAEAAGAFGRGEAERRTVADFVIVDDVEAAVELDDVAVVVAAPSSLVPALRAVEGLVDAAGDLELLLGGEGPQAQSSSGNITVTTVRPSSPVPMATMGKCLRGGRLLSRRSLRMSRTSTHILTRSLPEARSA